VTVTEPSITRLDVERLGLAGAMDTVRIIPMSGGVSSDICRVDAGDRVFVIKRALSRLRVADKWEAPTSRNRHEADWLELVARILPGAVPLVLARDDEAGLFAMEYFDPRSFPVWKEQLRDGHVDIRFAATVGLRLAAVHANTAGDPAIAQRFATDSLFRALRLDPYFEAAAQRHPEAADSLRALSARTLATRVALVHGDVSPKNILVGINGPVFLDAECAWFGDPAFDLAFCLNHLLLKCLWNRPAAQRLIEAFESLAQSYLDGVTWESSDAVKMRTAALLPALLLARVDGKSPVEYLAMPDREFVRDCALALIEAPPSSPSEIARVWASRLGI
jgi:aminoglycoside phosphotransferase (APT) family kinase protein